MKEENRLLYFLKRNLAYIVLSLCIIAVALSITLMLVRQQEQTLSNDNPTINNPVDTPSDSIVDPDDTPTKPVDVPIEFAMPVQAVISIGEYSETMVFNGTLGRFSTHLGLDFFADEGTAVLAVFDGTVESVENTLLYGTTIVIDHGNGLKTVYNSLADGDSVTVGQKVQKGQVIGEVSLSNRQEAGSGAHLHFEVIEDGKTIDPSKYLTIDEK
ncbi:MAG: M23 family metallopeptidase [Clostridia bacterium]|nr:M23 family metallopeptidase [Clostridia bacterium]